MLDRNLVIKIVSGNKEAEKAIQVITKYRGLKKKKQELLCKIDSLDIKGEEFADIVIKKCDNKINKLISYVNKELERKDKI
jgi:hypothetical protein